MSWETFKQNILRVANSPEGISDIDVVAELYAKEYDAAVKRGFDRTHSIKLVSGNVEMMKTFFKSALQKGLSSSQPYDLVGEMGEGVKAYWAGAVMATAPIPAQPAPGSLANIQVTQNLITDVGVWKKPISGPSVTSDELTPEQRIEYQESLEAEIEKYIQFTAQNELLKAATVSEAINKFTAILNENKDYNTEVPIQNAILGIVSATPVAQLPVAAETASLKENPLSTTVTKPTELQSQEEIDAELAAFLAGPELIVQGSGVQVSADNFSKGKPFVQGFKAGGGFGGGFGGSGAPYVKFSGFSGDASLGERAVQIAIHDAGQDVIEGPDDTGHPRILQIQALGGAKIGGGTGWAWCGATVGTWWTEAEGKNSTSESSVLKTHPNPASVVAWTAWAIKTGRYVDMKNPENAKFVPKAGDGIIYDWDNSNGASNHIGMFWKIDGGKWWGIDGNKGPRGRARIASHCIKDMGAVQGVVRI